LFTSLNFTEQQLLLYRISGILKLIINNLFSYFLKNLFMAPKMIKL